MRTLQTFALKAAVPLIRGVIIGGSRLRRFKQWRLGQCRFFGPEPFIGQIEAAAEKLKADDAAIILTLILTFCLKT